MRSFTFFCSAPEFMSHWQKGKILRGDKGDVNISKNVAGIQLEVFDEKTD